MVTPVDDAMKPDWNAIAKVGIPGVIAIFLVWRLAAGFDLFDKRLVAIEQQHVEARDANAAAKDLAGRALVTNERVLWVLRTMCVNDATSIEARERCMQER